MNAFPGINKNNGLLEASTCDLEVVRQVYERERRGAEVSALHAGRD